jgi:hypothetical protein
MAASARARNALTRLNAGEHAGRATWRATIPSAIQNSNSDLAGISFRVIDLFLVAGACRSCDAQGET